jgi:hypothetical protein
VCRIVGARSTQWPATPSSEDLAWMLPSGARIGSTVARFGLAPTGLAVLQRPRRCGPSGGAHDHPKRGHAYRCGSLGQLTALAFVAAIDDPSRIRRSRDIGAYLGLVPRRYQSGEVDYVGGISKCGDRRVRTLLYEAANVILTRYKGQLKLKDWAFAIARPSTQGAHRCGSPARPRPTSGGSYSRSAENYCSQRSRCPKRPVESLARIPRRRLFGTEKLQD